MILFKTLLITLFSICYCIDISYLEDKSGWKKIQDKNINIYCKEIDNQPYCKATKIYNYSIKEIKSVLDNKTEYPINFNRIMFCNSIGNDIVHMGVELPFPFYPRDYIVEYKYFKKNDSEYYQYSSKSNSQLNLSSKFIRLPNASGIWLMEKISIDSTKLTYLWNGELLGNIPKWVLPKAWKKQGNEILLELEEALNKNKIN